MDMEILSKLSDLINNDKMSEIEAERLLNAATRLDTGLPTGTTRVPNLHTHTK